MKWVSELAPLLIAIGGLGGFAAIILVPAQIRKIRGDTHLSEAQAAEVLGKTAITLLQPANEEIDRLRKKVAEAFQQAEELQQQLKVSQNEASTLQIQLSQMSRQLLEAHEEIERLQNMHP